MALQKTIIVDFSGVDVTIVNSYIRVDKIIEYSKDDGLLIDVKIYRNSTDSDNRVNCVQCLGYKKAYDPECTCNCLTECYEYLKTLNEYTNSVDV